MLAYETKAWIDKMHQTVQGLQQEALGMFEIYTIMDIKEIRTINNLLQKVDDAFWDLKDELPEVEE
tara:strand:+ start:127 stop:324 length:198 start_codon:yes stop_codon:yes gene_type:complete